MTLSTGRVLKPCGGVIGIDENFRVCEGYDNVLDGALLQFPDEKYDTPAQWDSWSIDEKRELAAEMIRRWSAYHMQLVP